jgi:hypothetical protein
MYIEEIDSTSGLPRPVFICGDHNLKNTGYAVYKSPVKDPGTFRAGLHNSLFSATAGNPTLRAILHEKFDKQRSDATRALFQNDDAIAFLEASANAAAREKCSIDFIGPLSPTASRALHDEIDAHEHHHAATVLRVLRDADTAFEDIGLSHEERLWRGYLVQFMMKAWFVEVERSSRVASGESPRGTVTVIV